MLFRDSLVHVLHRRKKYDVYGGMFSFLVHGSHQGLLVDFHFITMPSKTGFNRFSVGSFHLHGIALLSSTISVANASCYDRKARSVTKKNTCVYLMTVHNYAVG